MPLPTIVVAGAQKCGTSSLRATLSSHPQIHMATPKELHFFDRRFAEGLEHYAEQFTPTPEQVHWGEASPVYMYDRDARRRMAEAIPDAKIVVIVRDPTSRAYSHYWHERRLGRESAETFEQALALEPERLARGSRMDRMKYSYVDRGRYLDQILSLVEGHGRSNVHVMLLEDLVSDRVPTLRALLTFLEIDPNTADTLQERRTNRYREQATDGTIKPVEYPKMLASTREQLVSEFREPNDRLAAWLGRDLSAWHTA